MQISVISGGISNALFKVAVACDGKQVSNLTHAVTVRVYGEGSERFVEREREMRIMELLHEHGFGPELLGIFGNGRIESFLPMRCLSPLEMAVPSVAKHIAVTLATFHHCLLSQKSRDLKATRPQTPFGRIRKWLDVVEGFDFSDNPLKNAVYCTFDFDVLRREVDILEAAAEKFESPIVFSHNDLLSGNIMVPCCSTSAPENERMTFIDFEYADWAPRGFDWGNHFCEYAGFDCNYKLYPDEDAASTFITAYLTAANGQKPSRAVIQRAVAEANVFALAAHQYWGTWSIMQARWSKIEFNYLEYAKLRWSEYYKRKDEFLQAASNIQTLTPFS
jgi:ethanolamine kinase